MIKDKRRESKSRFAYIKKKQNNLENGRAWDIPKEEKFIRV